jgi:hypothetical protein
MASDVAQRFIALVVLAVAGWFLLKVVIGVVAGVAWFVAIVIALCAVVWALNRI